VNKLAASLLSILAVMVVSGCGTENDGRIVKKLDRQKGIESFVVRDSLYSSFQRQVRSREGTVEYSLLNSVITPYREIDSPQRFLFGIEVEGVAARSNGGRIGAIQVNLGDLVTRRKQEIADSLTSRYGKPTATIDTTISLWGLSSTNWKIRRWEGERVWLQEEKAYGSMTLRVINQPVVEKTRQLKQRADSLLQVRGSGSSVKKVGEFPLLSTSEHPMVKTESRYNSLLDSTVNEHTVSYEYLKDFFGLSNPMRPSLSNPMRPSRDERVITAEAYYDQETDSLNSLTISIYGEKYDPDGRGMLNRSAYEGTEEVSEILREKLGEPHLIIKVSKIPIGEEEIVENKVRYWYSPPVLVRLAPGDGLLGGIYEEGLRITFSRVGEGNIKDEVKELFWPFDFLHYS